MEFVRWDDDYSQLIWKVIQNSMVPVTTNQMKLLYHVKNRGLKWNQHQHPLTSYSSYDNQHPLQCGAPKIAKLFYNSNNYGLWYL